MDSYLDDEAYMKVIVIVVKHFEDLGLNASNAIEIIREIVRDKSKDECKCA